MLDGVAKLKQRYESERYQDLDQWSDIIRHDQYRPGRPRDSYTFASSGLCDTAQTSEIWIPFQNSSSSLIPLLISARLERLTFIRSLLTILTLPISR